MDKVDDILEYWFGRIEKTNLPTQNRSHIWFSGGTDVDIEIRTKFQEPLDHAAMGHYSHWEDDSRSRLALIILLDQFSRNVYRNMPQAFDHDRLALDVCLRGIELKQDHSLSLIERAFFYMPLMHSENFDMQKTSVQAYKMLADISLAEARPVFTNFLDFAIQHYEVVNAYGRFPQRNQILGRESTPAEASFLDDPNHPKW